MCLATSAGEPLILMRAVLSVNEKGCAVMLPAAIDSNRNINKYFALLQLMEKKEMKSLPVCENSFGAKCVVLFQSEQAIEG